MDANGVGVLGAGISQGNAGGTFDNVKIYANSVLGDGLYGEQRRRSSALSGSLTITDSSIHDNSVNDGVGGGHLISATTTIRST